LTLSAGGTLSATPAAAGSSTLTATAADANGHTGGLTETPVAIPAALSISGFPLVITAGMAGIVTVTNAP
jgi:hypothetical protein